MFLGSFNIEAALTAGDANIFHIHAFSDVAFQLFFKKNTILPFKGQFTNSDQVDSGHVLILLWGGISIFAFYGTTEHGDFTAKSFRERAHLVDGGGRAEGDSNNSREIPLSDTHGRGDAALFLFSVGGTGGTCSDHEATITEYAGKELPRYGVGKER